MCAVSNVGNTWMQQYPDYRTFPPIDYQRYMDALEKARKWDELMKQKDCVHPEKDAWHEAVKKFMKEHYGLEPKP
jgi:hypothetical protein